MAIYYKGKKVASNRNVNHKDFVDCRDVEFTNPQDGDVPTWDSTAQKLVNRPAHGVFELWTNPNENQQFAGQSIEIVSDVQFDALWIEVSDYYQEIILPKMYTINTVYTGTKYIKVYGFGGITAAQYPECVQYTRAFSQSYNSTTHKYTITFGDCLQAVKSTTTATAASENTNNYNLIPSRIYGVIHND